MIRHLWFFWKWNIFQFKKKLQVWDKSGALIQHLWFFWKLNFKKNYKCRINWHLWFFWHFLEKNTTTRSRAKFTSPKPNGQGSCPFEFGLSKITLDPVVVIFFKKCQKNHKCQLIRHLWFFWKWNFEKITSVGSANTCNFFDIFWKKLQRLDQGRFC